MCNCKKKKEIQNSPVTVKIVETKKNDELINKIVSRINQEKK